MRFIIWRNKMTGIKQTYLAKIKEIPEDDEYLVITNIAKSPLAPSDTLLHRCKFPKGALSIDITTKEGQKEYASQYLNQIKHRINGRGLLLRILQNITNWNYTIWLVCYEKSGFCHRMIVKALIDYTIAEGNDNMREVIQHFLDNLEEKLPLFIIPNMVRQTDSNKSSEEKHD